MTMVDSQCGHLDLLWEKSSSSNSSTWSPIVCKTKTKSGHRHYKRTHWGRHWHNQCLVDKHTISRVGSINASCVYVKS